jgi:hypothetical protein
MALRVRPTPLGVGNTDGSLPAVLNDWRNGVADSISARDSKIPPIRCRIYDCRLYPFRSSPLILSPPCGRSPYTIVRSRPAAAVCLRHHVEPRTSRKCLANGQVKPSIPKQTRLLARHVSPSKASWAPIASPVAVYRTLPTVVRPDTGCEKNDSIEQASGHWR